SANNQVFVPSKVIDDGLFSNTTDATDVTCRRRPYEGCDNANAAFTVPPVLCGTPAPGRHRKRHPAMLRLRFLVCCAGHPHPVGTASATRPCCAYGSSKITLTALPSLIRSGWIGDTHRSAANTSDTVPYSPTSLSVTHVGGIRALSPDRAAAMASAGRCQSERSASVVAPSA